MLRPDRPSDAPGARHAHGRGRDVAGAQRQAHAWHRRAAVIEAPGLRPFVVVGDDEASHAWLRRQATSLRERGAVGLVVNVETVQGLARLRALVPGVPLRPWSVTTWPSAWVCGITRC